jgi:hypothetical protein
LRAWKWFTYHLENRGEDTVTCEPCTPEKFKRFPRGEERSMFEVHNLAKFAAYLGHPIQCDSCDRMAVQP